MSASRNPAARLLHIRDEIRDITEAMKGVDAERFRRDYVLRRAASHALLIISEAAKSLPDDLRDRHPDVNWVGVFRLGNILRHEYHSVDPDTLWEILTGKLPELSIVIGRLIETTGADDED